MPKVVLKIIPDTDKNSLTFSKNYRLFTSKEPVPTVSQILSFSEDIEIGVGNNEEFVKRYFRYSTNQGDWSLWFELDPNNITSILNSIVLDETKDFFAEFKYEYDDGTSGSLTNSVKINEIKLGLETIKVTNSELYTPTTYCSDERCPAIIADRLSTFQPYSVDNAVGIYQELTFQTNRIFGQDVVYFRTEPDRKSGDYIFKEWTIFKVVDRKCLKVLIPGNNIPDNKPTFQDSGIGFQMPFEIHIDHRYFQTIFGKDSQPRKRDFLYFPLLNRMYEIQGSYLYRGFMMTPSYWKMQLKAYNPNIDTIIPEKEKTVIDNLILSSEDAFGQNVKETTKDATNPQQLTTISNRFDEVRSYLNPDMIVKNLGMMYNYGNLIDYYYDMTSINSNTTQFRFTSTPGDDYGTIQGSPTYLSAYEGSAIFNAWQNGAIRTGDLNINALGQSWRIKTDGPKTNTTTGEKYVNLYANSNMLFNTSSYKNLYLIDSETIKIKTRANAVVYKEKATLSESNPNLTFSCLFKINSSTQDFFLIRGYDETQSKGIQIYGTVSTVGSTQELSISLVLNSNTYLFNVGEIEKDKWYQIFMPVSFQFKQIGLYVYTFSQDPANTQNYNQLVKVFEANSTINENQFTESDFYCIPVSNIHLANIRIFNTMVQEEDHDYLISQLIIRDESMLQVIDNSRPRIGNPYVTRNR